MKKLTLIILTAIASLGIISAQDIAGEWNGTVDINNFKFRIILGFEKSGDNYNGYMISPDQDPSGQQIPASSVKYQAGEVELRIENIDFTYKGTLKGNDSIEGEFTQSGTTFPLSLSRGEIIVMRPQTPVPPFPYTEEEVSFKNERANITLYGTLTVPEGNGPFPAVVMVTGSGPQNRDEEIFDHKPFWVIADYLTRNGIAVLRYDDRGVGESEGNYGTATISDFARDAQAATEYLRARKNINKVGVIGHSEGGGVAFILGSRKAADFIVSLAGMGLPSIEILTAQTETLTKAAGLPEELVKMYTNMQRTTLETGAAHMGTNEELAAKYAELHKGTPLAGQQDKLAEQMSNPAFKALLLFNPETYLKKVTCPVLALNGEKDTQVIASTNLPAIEKALKENGNQNIATKEYEGLNHLFQTAKTGTPNEYGEIEETFNEQVMKDIADWILSLK